MQPRHVEVYQRFPLLKDLGFAVEHFPRYVNQTQSLHTLDVVLMTVSLRGRGRQVLDDLTFATDAGWVGITHYGQSHCVTTTKRGMSIYNVYLDLRGHAPPPLPKVFDNVVPAILPLHPTFGNRLNRAVRFHVDEPDRLGGLLSQIDREMRERKSGWIDAARDCFRVFLIECCRSAKDHGLAWSNPVEAVDPAWLERVRLILDRDFIHDHRLEDLAELAGVSVGYLCRRFRAYTGKTVFGYLLDRRIQAVMLRLRNSDDKILSVAMACGFNDFAYFSRSFKRAIGCTPSAYRRDREAD